MYYDRGELYSYLSPAVTQNETTGGPFGINQQEPFVTSQSCTVVNPPCTPTLQNPWGTSPIQPPGKANGVVLPNACTLASFNNPQAASLNCTPNTANPNPFYLGVYARGNKLPYTLNSTLDIQWQPRSDLAVDIGYVNALGRHEIIPIPFNQSRIATPTNPLCGPKAGCIASRMRLWSSPPRLIASPISAASEARLAARSPGCVMSWKVLCSSSSRV